MTGGRLVLENENMFEALMVFWCERMVTQEERE